MKIKRSEYKKKVLDAFDFGFASGVESTKPIIDKLIKLYSNSYGENCHIPKKVIYNDPATIVFWMDESKTVVKCSKEDTFSPEIGLAMCFLKRYCNNDDLFHKVLSGLPSVDIKFQK